MAGPAARPCLSGGKRPLTARLQRKPDNPLWIDRLLRGKLRLKPAQGPDFEAEFLQDSLGSEIIEGLGGSNKALQEPFRIGNLAQGNSERIWIHPSQCSPSLKIELAEGVNKSDESAALGKQLEYAARSESLRSRSDGAFILAESTSWPSPHGALEHRSAAQLVRKIHRGSDLGSS